MFALISVIAGAAVGCGVCAFGMWAFLKGVSSAILAGDGGLPDSCLSRQKKSDAERSSPSIAQQFSSMFKTERGE